MGKSMWVEFSADIPNHYSAVPYQGTLNVLFSFNRTFETAVSKVGGTSAIKINANLFCISLGLNKFFSLKKENLFSFSSLNQNFALPL